MKKRSVSFIVIVVCIVLSLTACNPKGEEPTVEKTSEAVTEKATQSTSSTEPDDGSPRVTQPGEFPVYTGETVTLTFFNGLEDKDFTYDNNDFTRYITDRTGVKVEFKNLLVNAGEKLNLMLASNDMTDVILYNTISPEMQMSYGAQGILIPVEDLLLEYGYYFKQNLLASKPNVLDTYRMADGKVYCVPKVMGAYEMQYQQMMIINTAWLDKLDLEMPTTTEEFKNVLMAFKTGDPNGNGKEDEIGLIGYSNSKGSAGSVWGFLMFPFIYHNGANSTLINRDGNEIFPAFTQAGWKEGLKYMNDLYTSGLIAPESFTIEGNDAIKQLSSQDDTIVGAYTTKSNHTVIPVTLKKIFDYEHVPPLAGPSGVRRHMYNPDNASVGDNFFWIALTKSCKYPEIAIRFLDTFYDQDVTTSAMYGVKGEDWREGKDGEVGINGEPATWVPLQQIWGTINNRAWGGASPSFWPWSMRYGEVFNQDSSVFNPSYDLYKVSTELYAPYAEEKSHFYDNLIVLPEELEDYIAIKNDVYTYVTQSIAEFITGVKDIDAEWDTYLDNLDAYGLNKLVQMYIDAAARQYGEQLTYRK